MTEIWQMGAAEIAQAVRQGALSATEVTKAHLARIAAVNPAINAIVQPCEAEALATAAQIDAARAQGQTLGPMAGVPVTIKVNVDQAGHATTNGLRLQQGLVAEADSPVVANLRRAGAVIVGRTNTPAFSMRWFTNNQLHGQTLNPRNKGLTPGGSSGGAAAAVAAGLCALGHGTDIAGSIRYPAYACGLHGLRPTVGRIPAYNASGADRFIGAQMMAVSGPIARSMADIGLGLAAMAQPDPRDPWYVPTPLQGAAYERRAAVCFAPDGMPVVPAVQAALATAADALRDAGWRVEEVDCPPMRAAAELNAQLWMGETQFGAAQLIAREGDPDASFAFAQMSRHAGQVGFAELMQALQARAGLMRQWDMFLAQHPLLLCPVSGQLPFAQQQDVASPEAFDAVYEAQLTQRGLPTLGMPALALATGSHEGQPVGVQLVAARWREDVLLAAGTAIEAASPAPDVATPDWA
jgi:amidase